MTQRFCQIVGRSSVVLLIMAAQAFADGQIEKLIPADAAISIFIPRPEQSRQRLASFLQRLGGDPARAHENRWLMAVGIPAGAASAADPIAFVYLRPPTEGGHPVVVFKPAEGAVWTELTPASAPASAKPAPPVPAVRRFKCGDSPTLFVVEHDGYFIAGPRRRDVSPFRSLPRRSVAAALTTEEREVITAGDVAAYVPLQPWRMQVEQWAVLARIMAAAGAMSAGGGEVEQQTNAVLASWFVTGGSHVVRAMKSLAVSARFEEAGLRLTHHHTFDASTKVGQYIAGIRPASPLAWRTVEPRPFLAAYAADIKNPQDNGLIDSMLDALMNARPVQQKLPPESRAGIKDAARAFYSDLDAESWVLCVGPRGGLEMFGEYGCTDAVVSLQQFDGMSRACGELAAFLMPGWDVSGRLKQVQRGKITSFEHRLNLGTATPGQRREIHALYGEAPVFQMAACSDHLIGYSLTEDENAIVRMASLVREARPGLESAAPVKELIGQLPEKPHVVALLDLRQLCCYVPAIVKQANPAIAEGRAGAGLVVEKMGPSTPHEIGPLMGWGGSVRGTTVHGELFVKTSDLLAALPSLRQLGELSVQRPAEAGSAASPGR